MSVLTNKLIAVCHELPVGKAAFQVRDCEVLIVFVVECSSWSESLDRDWQDHQPHVERPPIASTTAVLSIESSADSMSSRQTKLNQSFIPSQQRSGSAVCRCRPFIDKHVHDSTDLTASYSHSAGNRLRVRVAAKIRLLNHVLSKYCYTEKSLKKLTRGRPSCH